jgi:hypothetical protein
MSVPHPVQSSRCSSIRFAQNAKVPANAEAEDAANVTIETVTFPESLHVGPDTYRIIHALRISKRVHLAVVIRIMQ